ncbi:MAG: bifunctional 3,4-dihydroxy-2-butanone-4-phosphate synthase/GTP cyclohydrolase II [Candidatus Tectomicrobia bacterium]|uniref:Riboflavin biosynthesis protein RibBA n=1 Tax=Tectimicrobiota bacterium TaxID=2528274 RepID=A0A933LQP0_UNCTE|nr:bifunctional 3,4-dihydroxy-2-butanone-4-phosphate synthase/GTP cyclohydrolase II [Candidatus Tectomicrobia bacterium]
MPYKFNTIEEAIEDIRKGEMVILVDDEDRENEGDLTMAAEKVTPEAINFMAMYGRGLICVSLTAERVDELHLPPMTHHNTAAFQTAFTVSVDAKKGITTGISAADRATTILTTIDSQSKPEDLAIPGHIFPLRARPGGVLVRAGQTEGSVDLARLAGLYPAGVICEIMKDDGTMARLPDLTQFREKFRTKVVTIKDLIQHRMRTESFVRRVAVTNLPTKYGIFKAIGYQDIIQGDNHVALIKGEVGGEKDVLVRVHSECLTGDVFGSCRCDCGEQLEKALIMIEEAGKGVFLYMRQEGRGIGLMNKLQAYELQDQGKDTVEANEILGFPPDLRDYGLGAQILADLGLGTIRLLTNNPRKVVGLEGFGLQVVERLSLEIPPNRYNALYLKTKSEKLGHILNAINHYDNVSP